MNPLYKEIPQAAIPPSGTKPRLMLDLFITGETIPEQALCEQFGRNYRSFLQRLRGDDYLYWRFIEVKENNVIEARYLDPRHLSGDGKQDALARAVRRKKFKKKSFTDAIGGASRLSQAFKESEEANAELSELKKENAQ